LKVWLTSDLEESYGTNFDPEKAFKMNLGIDWKECEA